MGLQAGKDGHTLYDDVSATRTEERGLSVQICLDKQSLKPGETIEGAFLLKNVGKGPMNVDRRLFAHGNVMMFVFNEKHQTVRYNGWNLKACGIPPQMRTEIIRLEPGEVFGSHDIFSQVGPLSPGKYELMAFYDEGFGFGQSPLKGEFWEGHIRTNLVAFEVKA